jgi:hypothetical protein
VPYNFKINHTNNLNLARFFIANGVQNFGFSLDVINPNHVSIAQLLEIKSWLYQPAILIEIATHQTFEEIAFLQEKIQAQNIEIDVEHQSFKLFIHSYPNAFVRINTNDLLQLHQIPTTCTLVLTINNLVEIQNVIEHSANLKLYPIFIDTKGNYNLLQDILKIYEPNGICMSCIKEEKDFIDFDIYETILDLHI